MKLTFILLGSFIYNIIVSTNGVSGHVHRPAATCDGDLESKPAGPEKFSYDDGPTGPDSWPSLFRDCGGEKQSPVDIEMCQVQTLKLKPLQWGPGYFGIPKNMSIVSNGHTLILEAYLPSECAAEISGGCLTDCYAFHSIHFHWGKCDRKGSEHTINKFAYPMEMHVVHKRKGRQPGNAGDLFLVVAYFFQISDNSCPSLDNILKVGRKAAKKKNTRYPIKRYFTLASLAQPFSFEYITYRGSLTTPPCSESVRWIISPFPMDISRAQMDELRDISSCNSGFINNFRPTQPLNERTIYYVS